MNISDNKIPIPIAIAGLGRTGWGNHATAIATLPDKYKIVAVSDPEKTRREKARNAIGCLAFETFNELISGSNARLVVIATPSHVHCTQTIQAVNAGLGVICEKPMAVSLQEVDAMIEAARKTSRLLTIFQNSRYIAGFMKLRDVIASGVLGRIVQFRARWNRFGRRWDWQTLRKFGGGTLNNTVPHPLDQVLSLWPMDDPRIFCHAEQVLSLGDTEDHVKIIFHSPGMPLVDLEASDADAEPGPTWTVLGTQGHLQGGAGKLEWRYFDPRHLPERAVSEIPASDLTYNKEDIPWVREQWTEPPGTPPASVHFYQRLHAALVNGAEPDISPLQVRRVMHVIERCRLQISLDPNSCKPPQISAPA